MAQLLGKIEEIRKIKIVISDEKRNSRMATEVIKALKKSNDGRLPNGEVGERYIAGIPDCVSSHVRAKPEVAEVLGLTLSRQI